MALPWKRLLTLPLLLASLPGCPSGQCLNEGTQVQPLTPALTLVGARTNLSLSPLLLGCEEAPKTPSSLLVDVQGPDGQPIEAETRFDPAQPLSGAIAFTAGEAGSYRLRGAFEPLGGSMLYDIHAARDRSAETQPRTLPFGCDALEATTRGAWTCGPFVLREDGTRVLTTPQGRFAVAGDVVWLMEPERIQRYVDTGTALTLTGTWAHTQGKVESLLATEDELITLHAETLQRVTFDGTGLTGGAPTLWNTGLAVSPARAGGPTGLLLRVGNTLAIAARVLPRASSYANEACPYTLVNGRLERTATPCTPFEGTVEGFEPGGLWLRNGSGGLGPMLLGWHAWTEAGLVQRATLSLPWNLAQDTAQQRSPSVSPVLASPQLLSGAPRPSLAPPHVLRPVYDAARQRIVLEYLDSGLSGARASGKLLWGTPPRDSTGTGLPSLRVLTLPPALP
ncbi:hypothetical protein [Stigmatella erecta]|uniref:Lipoprotein n=1 Tax=Stigmatella erecta TaxID=83460 RepID=A0A1I0L5L5_9BACT|nr:hypothetical protein [Stigmatella erecta]SEU34652.1 hypothetical protein SAMN05443639_11996 [Stigmatella erecta]